MRKRKETFKIILDLSYAIDDLYSTLYIHNKNGKTSYTVNNSVILNHLKIFLTYLLIKRLNDKNGRKKENINLQKIQSTLTQINL